MKIRACSRNAASPFSLSANLFIKCALAHTREVSRKGAPRRFLEDLARLFPPSGRYARGKGLFVVARDHLMETRLRIHAAGQQGQSNPARNSALIGAQFST